MPLIVQLGLRKLCLAHTPEQGLLQRVLFLLLPLLLLLWLAAISGPGDTRDSPREPAPVGVAVLAARVVVGTAFVGPVLLLSICQLVLQVSRLLPLLPSPLLLQQFLLPAFVTAAGRFVAAVERLALDCRRS